MRIPRLATALALLSLLLTACGGGDSSGSDPTTATTAATTSTTSTATTATTAPTSTTATTASTAPSEPLEITVIANALAFDTDVITIKAGQEVTVTLNNKDSTADDGHNIHFFVGERDILTPIEEAPSVDSVTFTIDTPGEYDFFCDTHLVEMQGKLIVES